MFEQNFLKREKQNEKAIIIHLQTLNFWKDTNMMTMELYILESVSNRENYQI